MSPPLPETQSRLIALGYDPNLRHYGLVECYDSNIWTGWGPCGKGKMRIFLPYIKGKKWKIIDIFGQNVKPNKFTSNHRILRRGDMAGFQLAFGPTGVTALDIQVIKEYQREVDVERTVTKALNLIRDSGYVSPLNQEDLDFFGGTFVMDYPSCPIIPVLPQIQKAPKP